MKKKPLDKAFKVCPKCGHDWIAHFQMIEDDGTPEGKLIDPRPRRCMECAAPGCYYAQDEEARRKKAQEPDDEEDNSMIFDAMEPETKKKKRRDPDHEQMNLF